MSKWLATKAVRGRGGDVKREKLGEFDADDRDQAQTKAASLWPDLARPSKKYPEPRLRVEPVEERPW